MIEALERKSNELEVLISSDLASVDVHKHLLKAQSEINEAIEAINYEKENG